MSKASRDFKEGSKVPAVEPGPSQAALALMQAVDHAAKTTARTILQDMANPRLGCTAALEK